MLVETTTFKFGVREVQAYGTALQALKAVWRNYRRSTMISRLSGRDDAASLVGRESTRRAGTDRLVVKEGVEEEERPSWSD